MGTMAAMSTPFVVKLNEAVERNNSLVCVGLDPDPALMPLVNGRGVNEITADDIVEFNRKIIEATADLVCCFKPNVAFFEAFGSEGSEILRRTLAAIPPDVPVIADAKRGDIGNSSAAYARAIFDELSCDAMTVNAYGGKDAIEPFLEYTDKGVIVWCRSSNPSAIDFQDLEVDYLGEQMPLWQAVARKSREWNRNGNVGIVMGATYPEQLKEARELCPEMPILVPGIGNQEGNLRDAVLAGVNKNRDGIIVNASRSVLYASRDKDYATAARSAAAQLRENVNRYREERPAFAEA
jgi:orotidine-5'-phosphate decarboxylase